MIYISDTVKKIESFLGAKKFKIFVRINFTIDVYVFVDDVEHAQDYKNDFIKYLLREDDDFYTKQHENIKVEFHVVDEEEEDPFYANMLSRSETVDWGPRYRFDSLLKRRDGNHKDPTKTKTPIVTFYSYKGGMGRTTTMVAYALSLATGENNQRKRVVVVDCDLEAPGYLNFFNLSGHNGLNSGKKNGLVEFICDAQFTTNPECIDINDYIINVGNDNSNSFAYNNLDNIWLVPAGNLNEGYADLERGQDRNDYLEGLAKINLSSVPTVVKYFRLLFDKINESDIKPDIILIDSRTGFNDVFGTAALYLSSCVVGFFGFSRQTQPGLINLLKDYYRPTSSFNLKLVFSILPKDASEEWISMHKKDVLQYINYIGSESKDLPSFMYLHRDQLLEKIGTGDEQSDSDFVDMVRSKKYKDYNSLFDEINRLFFANTAVNNGCATPIQLRNVVLRHLKETLPNVSNFAEDAQINEEQFFYRECMKELFEPQKFLIQGYKGTGKTYLYKALADKTIAANIQKEWARSEDALEPIFVNILPAEESSTVFSFIQYASIDEPEYYFDAFWQIYTWNVLLLLPEFDSIKQQSELLKFIEPVDGYGNASKAYKRIDEMIKEGVSSLILIERDFAQINAYLEGRRQRLFVLYDRLDTCINPLRWNKAVSPLINYWRNNCRSFSNISPKIFVRTDLFKQIEGTNTERLENSIVHIEWSIGEVFGFFFKLIFSDKKASEAYWAMAEKANVDKDYIRNMRKAFDAFPKNQFKSLKIAEMSPVIRIFFGSQVKVGTSNLGTPWDYFEKELANADNSAISLRPFINTFDSNAVDKALAKTERHVLSIVSSEIYASKAVREKTTERYFDDLTRDPFSKDLIRFKEVIRTAGGEKFRFKSLTESQYEELISITFGRITESVVVKSQEDLKRLITANGIMAEKITTQGRSYRFAPIYWYSWGLVNSDVENEGRKFERKMQTEGLVEGKTYEGEIEYGSWPNGKHKKYVVCPCPHMRLEVRVENETDLYQGDNVTFVVRRETNKKDSSKFFWYATDVEVIKS